MWILRTLRTPFYIEHLRWLLLLINFYQWISEIKNKYTWFSRKIFVSYRKWKINNVVVLDVRSAAHLEAFLIIQVVLFLYVSDVLGVCRGVRMRSHASYAEAWHFRVGVLKRKRHFSYFFSRFIIFIFRNTLNFAKQCYPFEERLFFSATVILWKKSF